MMNQPRFTNAARMALFALAISGCAPSEGGGDGVGPRGPAAESAVYAVFPEIQPRWTEWPYRFEARRDAAGREVFSTPLSELPKDISVEVPTAGGEPVVVKGKDGFAIRVWDDARRGRAELTASGLTYGRAGGGTSFWTARESGAEEWLFLPEGATALEVASYRIEGGHPRQHEWAIDVYDERDQPRVTITAPQVFATDGQRVDAKMVLDGDKASVVLTKWVEGSLLIDPAFVPAGDMSGDRKWHDALLLPSDRVMVLGGYHQVGLGSTDLATVEFFDPITNTWSPGPSAAAPRIYPTMTILDDGRVLVVSKTLSGPQPWTEIYDEQLNAWWTPAQPGAERNYHQAVKLNDGRVLVAGGSRVGKTAEIYNPINDSWTSIASLTNVHVNQELELLPNGDAIVVGGQTAEAYSLATGQWTFKATPIYKNTHAGTAVLPNGNFVLTGGTLVAANVAWGHGTQLYDVVADTWTQLAPSIQRRDDVPASLMKDGSIFVVGGYDINSGAVFATSEIYDLAADAWSSGPLLAKARAAHAQTRLVDGRILVSGGYDPVTMLSLASCEILSASLAQGAPCSSSLDCASFLCVDGVCCATVCSGACMACSGAAGGSQDGTCTTANNVACDDSNLCTLSDTCALGACQGTPKSCPGNPGECFGPDTCSPATGSCVSNMLPDGTPCSIGMCSGGVCVSSGPGAGGGGGTGGSSGAQGGGGAGGASNGQGGGGNGQGGSAQGGGGTGGEGAQGAGGTTGGTGGYGGVGAGGAGAGGAVDTSSSTSTSAGAAGAGREETDEDSCACGVVGFDSGEGSLRALVLVLGTLLLRIRRRFT